MACPSEVPPAGCSPVDRGDRLVVVVAGHVRGERALVERDHADVHGVRLRPDEPGRGGLRGGQPARRDIGRRHAVGDVEGQDHGAGDPGHGDGRVRPGDREQQQSQGDQEQQRGYVPAQPGPATGRHLQSGRGQRAGPLALQQPVARRSGQRRRPRRRRASGGTGKLIRACVSTGAPCRPARRPDPGRCRSGGRSPRPGASWTPPPSPGRDLVRSRCWNSGSLVSASSCSPVSASSTRTSPRSGRSSSTGSTTRIATTSCRWLSRVSAGLPVDVADEVGDDEDQAAPASGGGGQLQHGGQVGGAPVRCGGRAGFGEFVGQAQHVGTAGARRDHPLVGLS